MKITPCCEKLDAGAYATRHLSYEEFIARLFPLQWLVFHATIDLESCYCPDVCTITSSSFPCHQLCSAGVHVVQLFFLPETLSLMLYVALLFQDIYFDLTK